jgi:hypothetical protein
MFDDLHHAQEHGNVEQQRNDKSCIEKYFKHELKVILFRKTPLKHSDESNLAL